MDTQDKDEIQNNNEKHIKDCNDIKASDMSDTDQHKNISIWHTKNTILLKKLGSETDIDLENDQLIEYKKNWIKKRRYRNADKEQIFAKNRILCFNVLNSGECSYSHKCLYAHSLDEQSVDTNKNQALELLKELDLSTIDLVKNKNLRENLLVLTKLCNDCINNACPGGYNCKYGACNKDVLICSTDFQRGDCKNYIENDKCINGYHLTLKNMVPLIKQQLLHNFPNEHFLKEKKKYMSMTLKCHNNEQLTNTKKKVITGYRSLKSIININEQTTKKQSNVIELLCGSDISSDDDILYNLDDIDTE